MEIKNKKEDNIYIFPIMKRHKNQKIDLNVIPKEDLNKFVHHYMKQLLSQMSNHGIPMTTRFFKDYNLVHESLRSALMRQSGYFHPIQDIVDTLDGGMEMPELLDEPLDEIAEEDDQE